MPDTVEYPRENLKDAGKAQLIVGPLIRGFRESKGWTQGRLAEMLGYKRPNFVGMIESGAANFPIERWEAFAEALDIPKNVMLEAVIKEKYPSMLPYLTIKPARR